MSNTTTRSGIASALSLAGTIAVVMLNAPVASAAPAREPEPPGPTYTSVYAEPLEALGGRTMAQYLADHQARDRRLG